MEDSKGDHYIIKVSQISFVRANIKSIFLIPDLDWTREKYFALLSLSVHAIVTVTVLNLRIRSIILQCVYFDKTKYGTQT